MTAKLKNTATDIAPLVLTDGAILTNNIDDYPSGIIIPVDKPYRWTSADVIRKIKFAAVRYFGKKNLKVGHAGTLDPLATGVLLVCTGKATKLAEALQSHDKEYIADIAFGATTPSYDREKEIDRYFPYEHITEAAVRQALGQFIGEQDQIAPLFSAKSVDGVRAYEIARKMLKNEGPGSLDETAAALVRTSRIRINALELISFYDGEKRDGKKEGRYLDCACGFAQDDKKQDSAPDDAIDRLESRRQRALLTPPGVVSSASVAGSQDGQQQQAQPNASEIVPCASVAGPRDIGITTTPQSARINVTDNAHLRLPHAIIRISCSKGTYIRAFARDLGEALGSGAYLEDLQRSKSGDFDMGSALSIEHVLETFGAHRGGR